jgi:hypothetical protein
MCQSEEEMLQHLFIDCIYAKETWNHALGSLTQRFYWPQCCADFFNRWSIIIRGTSKENLYLRDIGMPFPNTSTRAFGLLATNKSSIMKPKAPELQLRRLVPF